MPFLARPSRHLALATLLATGLSANPAAAQLDIALVDSSVVFIVSLFAGPHPVTRKDAILGAMTGTGFVINKSGDVVTNNHVVGSAPPTGTRFVKQVVFDGGTDAENARPFTILWKSAEKDLAVIHVDGLRRPPVTLAKSDVEKGDKVWALGFPGVANLSAGAEVIPPGLLVSTLTEGIVGRVTREPWPDQPVPITIVQHQASINSGNSGGPLLNACGEVVGVNTAGIRNVSAINFASAASTVAESLRAQNLQFSTALSACSAPWGGSDRFLLLGAALMAATAMVLALRRPRQQLARVVERLSRRHSEVPAQVFARPASPPPGSANGGPGWVLVGFDSAGRTLRFAMDASILARARHGYSLGRDPAIVDFAVADESVSRCHARIFMMADRLVIEDLDSTQGTVVGDARQAPFTATALKSGARIQIGATRLQLYPA